MKLDFSSFNEKLFSSKEVSGIGSVGTLRLLRGSVAKVLNFIGRALSYTSVRSYGCFLLSFGIVSLFLQLGEYYFKSAPDVSLFSLIFCLAISLVSIPLLLISGPMCIVVQDFRLTNVILFDFMAVKRMHRNVEQKSISPLLAVFLGFIPAAVSYFVPVEQVFLAMVVGAVVSVAATSPEFSMILTILLLPYLPLLPNSDVLLCSLSVITFLSYALKVIVGKRVLNIDTYSVIGFLLIAAALVGGAVTRGSFNKDMLVLVILLIGYFPVSNVIINRRLADSAVNAVIMSAIPISVISVIEFVVEHPSTNFTVPEYSTPGVSAFFSSPSALSAFILVAAIMTLVFAIENRKSIYGGFCFFVFVLEIAVLGLIMYPGAWIAAILAAFSYTAVRSRRIPLDFLTVFVIIPHLIYLLPTGLVDKLYGYLNLSNAFSLKLSENGAAMRIFGDNLWFGIGCGGVDSASNNFWGIGAELGVVFLSLFVLSMVLRFRHLSYYRLYSRNSLVMTTSDMSVAAIVALLACGAFDFIFADVTVLYLFLLVFALSTAVLRTARRENDDRLGYYGDSSSSDSSALDISVNR